MTDASPNLCDFLILGAMKAGTTTLYKALRDHPDIFMPEAKEPALLVRDQTDTDVQIAYRRLMRPARQGQKRGEASTVYTKRPRADGCADRARRCLGPQLKLIYLERDPIDRAISHYHHNRAEGLQTAALDVALLSDPKYLDYGRADWQLAPWIAAFGEQALLRLPFDRLKQDPDGVLHDVATFLDVDPARFPKAQARVAHNVAGQRLVVQGWRHRLLETDLVQLHLKPVLPRPLRQVLRHVIARRAPAPTEGVSPDVRRVLEARLADAPHSF